MKLLIQGLIGLCVGLIMGGCILFTRPYRGPEDLLCLTVNSERIPSIDGKRLSVEPSVDILAGWIKHDLIEAAEIRGVPITVHEVKFDSIKGWIATVGVDGVNSFETLNCIAKTLIQIPFVTLVEGKDIKVRR